MTLQVAFNNQIISNSVVFEYKARALPTLPSSQHDWLSLDGKNGVLVTFLGTGGGGKKELAEGQGPVLGSAKGRICGVLPLTVITHYRSACVWLPVSLILTQPLLATDEACEAGLWLSRLPRCLSG